MDDAVYILIERYLAGDLSADETKAFEDRMKRDADFAEKVAVYRSLSEDLKYRFSGAQEEQRLRESLRAISVSERTTSAKVVSWQWYHWAAAASIALLAIAWFYTSSPTVPQYSQYAFHESLSLSERGSDSLNHQAEDAFNAGNYTEAIRFFDALLKADPGNTELQLYKGISLLEVNRYQEADSMFHAIKNSTTVFRDKATWYLALSALKQKDYEKCKALLRQLPPDSEDHRKATEILKRL